MAQCQGYDAVTAERWYFDGSRVTRRRKNRCEITECQATDKLLVRWQSSLEVTE